MKNNFYNEILERIERYRRLLRDIGFANYEMQQMSKAPETEEELLEMLDVIIDSSKELNYIFNEAPDSFFVCDSEGVCLRVNKTFEKMTHINRHDVYGKNVKELDEKGIFRPSVCSLTLREKRPVSVLQEIGDVSNMVVTGVPVFNEKGTLFRAFTNAIKVDDVEPMNEYIRKTMNKEPFNFEKNPIIASCQKMKEVLALADMVKNTDSNILITGETGVGKGVLASYIHDTGIRSHAKMISINCGAIPENLLESELFGYESGAFTGASQRGKPGLIELSDGGTLFLDEISELPLMLQVKVLHFLQTKKLTRVGGTTEIQVNTRIIAASNKSLEEEVQKGTFRADLYYRINVIPIEIPPLRERREDLRELTNHFMNLYMKKYNKKMKLEESTMNYIMDYDWKGNVRELENYIERLVVTNDSSWSLNLETDFSDTYSVPTQNKGRKKRSSIKEPEEVEKERILKAYRQYKSSYKVAEVLGISQSTAYRKIRKYLEDE